MLDRVFLGLGTHLLHALADRLVDQTPAGNDCIDLRSHLLVLPTGRARWRMEHLLLDRAADRGVRLVPPEILTPGRLLDRFIVPTRATADACTAALAWLLAVQSASQQDIAALVEHDEPCSVNEQHALANRLGRLARELAAADLPAADVSDRLEQAGLPTDPGRWVAAGHVHGAMCGALDAMGLIDRDLAHATALNSGAVYLGEVKHVHVVAADLAPRARRLLDLLIDRGATASVIIHGDPTAHAEAFDDEGRLDIDWWCRCPIDLDERQVVACDLVEDQIAVAFEHLADLGEIDARDVRLVVPDHDLLPVLDAAARAEGIGLERFDGPTIADGRVGRLLGLLADALEDESAVTIGDLVRHPDVETWLEEHGARTPVAAWDEAWSAHLPARLDGLPEGSAARRAFVRIAGPLLDLIGPLHGRRPVSSWPAPLRDVLMAIFDRDGAAPGRTETDLQESIKAAHDILADLHELPPDAPGTACSDVLRLVLSQLETASINTGPRTGGIEVIGWLDAHLDDSPDVIITGLNECNVPGPASADAWLTESHRDALGLGSRRRRTARDAYLLDAMLRSARRVQLVFARRSADADPIAPSSLLLRAQGDELARRTCELIVDELPAGAACLANRISHDAHESGFDRWPVPTGPCDIASISVSSFKTWLSDRYAFLLERDRRIKARPVQTRQELDAMGYGTLVHMALEEWGLEERAKSKPTTDVREVREAMLEALNRVVAAQFGSSPLPAVRLQVATARHRLRALAPVQTDRASAGWRVHEVERVFTAGEDAPLFPDESGLSITGKIDRIDLHDTLGYQALDYKTSMNAPSPREAHGSPGDWKDLQLPMYRVLLRSVDIDIPPGGLGYVLVPPEARLCRIELASWTRADLDDAEARAAELVASIVEGTLLDDVHADIAELTA